MSKICCVCNESSGDLITLKFEDEAQAILEKLKEFIDTSNAGYICSGCESDLSVAYDFQRRCEKSISSWTIKNCKEEDDRTVTDVRPFTCDFCLQKFTTKGNLETHVKRHTQKKGQYSCKKCALRFLVKTHFQQHVATHFGNNQKK